MLHTDIAGLCGEHSQCSGHSGFSPAQGCVLRLPAALYGAGPALCAVPVCAYSTKARTRLGLCFVPSLAGEAQAARSLTGALSQGAVSLIPSAVPASVSACSHPSRVRVPVTVLRSWPLAATLPEGRLGACLQFGRGFAVWGPISGAEFAPFPSLLPPASSGG